MSSLMSKTLALGLVATTCYNAPALANPLSFFYSTDGSTYSQFGATLDGSNAATIAGIVNNTAFTISASAVAPPVLASPGLETSFVGISASGVGTFYVAVVETGVSDPTITGFGISFGNAVTSTTSILEAAATIVGNNSTLLAFASLDPSGNSLQISSAAGLPVTYGLSEIFVGTFGAAGGSIDASVSVFGVPEPMSLALLGAGLGATVITRHRRKSV